jgi:hypothetical protein
MLGKTRVWTAVSLLIMMLAALVATLATGCCELDDWKTATLPEAKLRFEVPANWKVNLRRPGKVPSESAETATPSETGDGAVLTALPVMEDAALILIATEKTAAPDLFARRVTDFIPLKGVRFTTPMQAYSLNGLHGFAGEGYGRLPSDGTAVYFRCMVLDVEGKPVIATLYAEESQKERYSPIFDTIVARIHPMSVAAMVPKNPDVEVVQDSTRSPRNPLGVIARNLEALAGDLRGVPKQAIEGT